MIVGSVRDAPSGVSESHTGDRRCMHDLDWVRNGTVSCRSERDRQIGIVTADVPLGAHASRDAGRLRFVAGRSRCGRIAGGLCARSRRAQDLARRRGNRGSSDNRSQHERPQTQEHYGQYTSRKSGCHSCARRSLSAFAITDTELKLMAAAAIIGDRSRPKNG